jgi:hypothetical protein
MGVKVAGAWGWQPHHLHVPNVMKCGSLNLLESSGPHWACYGTPLPLPFTHCHFNTDFSYIGTVVPQFVHGSNLFLIESWFFFSFPYYSAFWLSNHLCLHLCKNCDSTLVSRHHAVCLWNKCWQRRDGKLRKVVSIVVTCIETNCSGEPQTTDIAGKWGNSRQVPLLVYRENWN